MSGCLVWRRHPTIHNQQLSVLNQVSNAVPLVFVLEVPPHLQELHLGIGESSARVGLELCDDGSEHLANRPHIEVNVSPVEVLLEG